MFRDIAADPEVMRYIADGKPWPEERARNFVERQIALYQERGFCLWKVVPRAGGPLIGFCGLQPLPELGDVEIGWWLARAWWGRGLATEAARAALRDGFERAGLRRIISIAQPANTASIGIMRKLGMRFEAIVQPRGIPVVLYAAAPLATGRGTDKMEGTIMNAEGFTERILDVDSWQVRLSSYQLGDTFHCKADNVSPGAALARTTGATREEAEQKALDRARQLLSRTHRREV